MNSKEQQNVKASQVFKPNSVIPDKTVVLFRDGNYLSCPDVTIGIQRSTRKVFLGEHLLPVNPEDTFLLDLAPSGVYHVPNGIDPVRNPVHRGTSNITIEAVGSYPAFSPLSQIERCPIQESIFSVALSVSLLYRDPGCYPALLFMEFGLSSLPV